MLTEISTELKALDPRITPRQVKNHRQGAVVAVHSGSLMLGSIRKVKVVVFSVAMIFPPTVQLYILKCTAKFRVVRQRSPYAGFNVQEGEHMARHYSTRDFFRQMPNALLARYFAARAVFDEFDFSAMSETLHDELFTAWLALPEAQRNAMDAEFRDIFEMSCEKGCHAILDEAEWHFTEDGNPTGTIAFTEMLAALVNHFERAMVTYLDHNPFWRGAKHFYHADTLPFWRKRKNLPHNAAQVDAASIQALANRIRT